MLRMIEDTTNTTSPSHVLVLVLVLVLNNPDLGPAVLLAYYARTRAPGYARKRGISQEE